MKNRLTAKLLLTVIAGIAASMAAPLATAESITFTDQRDRTITLEKEAERVAIIPIPAASMFMSVDGGSDKLVAMHPLAKAAIKGHILETFYPKAIAIPSDIAGPGLNFAPNVEALLSLDPDLVFQWGHLNDSIIDPLVNAGLNVALIKIGQEKFTRKWLSMMGAVTGNEEKAAKMISWRDDVQAELKAETDKISADQKPRVLYFMNYLSKLRVAGGKSYNNFYIDLAGGQNVASDLGMFVEVGPEQIIAWDPEVILLNGFEKKLSPQDVYDNPLFADLSAVKKKRVYKMPLGGYRWDPPNQESPLTWLWLSMVLHPERFDWDLPKRMDDNYKVMYGQGVNAENVKQILRFKMNKDAANYDIFAPDKP